MLRFLLRIDWVLAAFVTVMSGPSITPSDPAEPPCRGGILYGTVWATSPGGWTGTNVSVYAVRTDETGILGSSRTDAAGRYRICGLPLRTRFQLVAVPGDASGMGHVETMILTLEGGQQRNIYPTRTLQRLPDLVLRRPAEPVAERSPAVTAPSRRSGTETVVQSQIRRVSEAEALARAAQYVPAPEVAAVESAARAAQYVPTPGVAAAETAARATQYVPTPGVAAAQMAAQAAGQYPAAPSTVTGGGKIDSKFVEVPDRVAESTMRVVSGDGLLMYFTGSEPRYMQLRVDGLDGRGCYFEFDWGIDEQAVEPVGSGYDLVNPAWGRIRVQRQESEIVALDLSDVFTPVCRARTASGGPLVWRRGSDGWERMDR